MRHFIYALCLGIILGSSFAHNVQAAKSTAAAATTTSSDTASSGGPPPGHMEVTADKSLEWYDDRRIYVARGNAKAIRGDMTVYADLLTAHERDLPVKPGAAAKTAGAASTVGAPSPSLPPSDANKSAAKSASNDNSTGDIDKMTAEGNVRVVTSKSTTTGDHGVYDLNQHVAYMTGNNLKYQTPEEVVTAKDSLEYWEDKKIAVARGNAVGIRGDRHVEGDTLTAKFRDMPNGKSELHTLTAEGHVVVITTTDVSRAEHAVYDVNRNIAVLTGNVRITRPDGTQLTGDVGEVDFAANQSRLLNEGSGRVRALLTSKTTPKTGPGKQQQAATVAP